MGVGSILIQIMYSKYKNGPYVDLRNLTLPGAKKTKVR